MTEENGNMINGDIEKSSLNHKQKMEWQTSRWKNRRRMAWSALISMILVTFILLFYDIPLERLKVISEFIVYYYFIRKMDYRQTPWYSFHPLIQLHQIENTYKYLP